MYSAWKDYKDENYSEDFKWDRKKKDKDDHMFFQYNGVSSHKLHYIIYEGDLDKDQFRDSFDKFTVEESNQVALAAVERVIASGVVEMKQYSSTPDSETKYSTSTEEDILTNSKTTQKTEYCGGFEIRTHPKQKEKLYPRGSEDGLRRCIAARTREIDLTSSGYTGSTGYIYDFSAYEVSSDTLDSYGFTYNFPYWYHKTENSISLPAMSYSKAKGKCAKYY